MAVNKGSNTIGKIYKGSNQIGKVYKGSTLVYSAEIVVVGPGAETTDFISGGFGVWSGGWMNGCSKSGISFCGGDGQQYSGGQSVNFLPTGYSNIKITWGAWSDTEGYNGQVSLVGSDGSQITVISGATHKLKNGVSYRVMFSAYHTYTRTVTVSISSIVLSD